MMDFVTPNRVKELNTLPIPIAAPPNAIVAAPDPINLASCMHLPISPYAGWTANHTRGEVAPLSLRSHSLQCNQV